MANLKGAFLSEQVALLPENLEHLYSPGPYQVKISETLKKMRKEALNMHN